LIKWLENDQVALKKLVPEDTVVISTGRTRDQTPDGRAASRRGISRRRRKMINLEFPKTEVQHFGDVAVTWSD